MPRTSAALRCAGYAHPHVARARSQELIYLPGVGMQLTEYDSAGNRTMDVDASPWAGMWQHVCRPRRQRPSPRGFCFLTRGWRAEMAALAQDAPAQRTEGPGDSGGSSRRARRPARHTAHLLRRGRRGLRGGEAGAGRRRDALRRRDRGCRRGSCANATPIPLLSLPPPSLPSRN